MYPKFILAAALAATAAPAFADTSVTINVAGLDPATAHRKIYEAAQEACFVELQEWSLIVQFYNRPICLRDTIAKAEADYNAMNNGAAPQNDTAPH